MRIIKPALLMLSLTASAALAETGGLQAFPSDMFHDNILQNPSFESGAETWYLPNGAYVTLQTDGGRTGTNYIRIGGNGALSSQYIQQRPFAYHRRFRLSFWYKTAGADPGPNARVSASRKDFTHGSYLYGTDRTGNNAATGGCGAWLPKDGTLKYISVVSNLATATTTIPHQLVAGNRVTVTGSRRTALNRTYAVSSVLNETQFTFETQGVADEAISGGQLQVSTDGSLAGGVGQWTRYCNDYVFFTSEHYGDQAQIQIFANNLAAGSYVLIDDVEFTPVTIPLVVYPTYPNYRGMLWPDQGNIMRWKAVVTPPAGYQASDLRVEVDLLDSRRSVMETITAPHLPEVNTTIPVYPTTAAIQWNGHSVAEMTYDASGLPDGVYYLRGRLRTAGGDRTLYRYPAYKIVKEAPSVQRDGWNFWIDKDNRLMAHGKPRFVWGTFWTTSASCNISQSPGAGMATEDGWSRIAVGCAKGCGSGCTPLDAAITSWNLLHGENDSSLFNIMKDVAMNSMIVYGGWEALTPGIACSGACAATACSGYSPNHDNQIGLYRALAARGMWNFHITNTYDQDATNQSDIPFWIKSGNCNFTPAQAIHAALNQNPGAPTGRMPSQAGLYMADEPPYGHLVAGVKSVFEKARYYYDMNMGGVTFGVLGPVPYTQGYNWNQTLDALGADPYFSAGMSSDDVFWGLRNAQLGHLRTYNNTLQMQEAAFGSRPVWMATQLFTFRAATPWFNDLKIQTVQALAGGATGLWQWMLGTGRSGLSTMKEARYLDFRKNGKVIADLMPILEQPIQDLTDGPQGHGKIIAGIDATTPDAIKCSSRQFGSRVLLACANITNTPQSATITLTSPIANSVIRAYDGSAIDFSQSNAFADRFSEIVDSGTVSQPLVRTIGTDIYTCAGCSFTTRLRVGDVVSISTTHARVVEILDDTSFRADLVSGSTGHQSSFTWSRSNPDSGHLYLLGTGAAGQ